MRNYVDDSYALNFTVRSWGENSIVLLYGVLKKLLVFQDHRHGISDPGHTHNDNGHTHTYSDYGYSSMYADDDNDRWVKNICCRSHCDQIGCFFANWAALETW